MTRLEMNETEGCADVRFTGQQFCYDDISQKCKDRLDGENK